MDSRAERGTGRGLGCPGHGASSASDRPATGWVSNDPSSGSINLPEQLTELRETHLLVYYKGCYKEYTQMKRRTGRGMGQGAQSCCALPRTPPSGNLPVLSSLQAPHTLSFRESAEASLHRHDRADHRPLVILSTSAGSLPSPEVHRWSSKL